MTWPVGQRRKDGDWLNEETEAHTEDMPGDTRLRVLELNSSSGLSFAFFCFVFN